MRVISIVFASLMMVGASFAAPLPGGEKDSGYYAPEVHQINSAGTGLHEALILGAPPATGACCTAGGVCQVLTQSECVALLGTYLGDNTNCSPNPCPPPPLGACCLADCTCQILTMDACPGVWLGPGTTCQPYPCSCPPGACCWPDGACTVVMQPQCGGDWQGVGTTCVPNNCPQPDGACCYPDGTCQFVNPYECQGISWSPNAPCSPNPCVVTEMACCYPDCTCAVLSADACAASGGYVSGELSCDPNPCDCPPPVPTKRGTWGGIKSRYR
jgi:hypothetical protein